MARETEAPPRSLYEEDETAWLELTADLIAKKRFEDVDQPALVEYLTDMAIRDRREVASRLTRLIQHVLKYDYQPSKRTKSWGRSILAPQDELHAIFSSRTLRQHAKQVMRHCYNRALKLASFDTGLPKSEFPTECPYTLEQLLEFKVTAE